MTEGRTIVGDKRSEGERDEYDFYPTPEYATWGLLSEESFESPVWEPASGDGAMSKVLEEAGYDVISTELREGNQVYGTGGVDFLKCSKNVPTIVTNPPFRLAEEFIEHGLKCCDKLAIFAKLTFLESKSRYQLFNDTPLKKVYVFSNRVQLTKKHEKARGGSMVAYAWYVWENGYEYDPTIDWIISEPGNYTKQVKKSGKSLDGKEIKETIRNGGLLNV